MDNTQLRDVELISQESPGALILSSVWNQNFNRLREVINENNETTEGNFDKIISRNIPSEALEILGQTEASNVMEQIILISTILNTKANAVDVTDDMKSFYDEITYDKATGTFRFVKRDGSVLVVDTLLEKMPVSAELVTTKDDVFLRITNDDGSYTETPVSDLVSDYNFLDGDVIQCSVTQKDSNFKVYDVSFQIKQNSITEEYLDSNVLRLINETATNIAALVETAKTASNTSATSANQALEYKNSASLSSTEAREASENAIESAIISKSYAVGGTATRPNEEYDNAKYWAEVAKFQAEKAGKGDANFIIGNTSPEKENTIWFNTDGEYTGSDAAIQDVLLQVKDSAGSLYILHPKTTVENVEGLQEELDNLEALDYEVVTKEEFDSMEKQEDVLYLIEDDPEAQAVKEHIVDTDIHVTAEEKEKWNIPQINTDDIANLHVWKYEDGDGNVEYVTSTDRNAYTEGAVNYVAPYWELSNVKTNLQLIKGTNSNSGVYFKCTSDTNINNYPTQYMRVCKNGKIISGFDSNMTIRATSNSLNSIKGYYFRLGAQADNYDQNCRSGCDANKIYYVPSTSTCTLSNNIITVNKYYEVIGYPESFDCRYTYIGCVGDDRLNANRITSLGEFNSTNLKAGTHVFELADDVLNYKNVLVISEFGPSSYGNAPSIGFLDTTKIPYNLYYPSTELTSMSTSWDKTLPFVTRNITTFKFDMFECRVLNIGCYSRVSSSYTDWQSSFSTATGNAHAIGYAMTDDMAKYYEIEDGLQAPFTTLKYLYLKLPYDITGNTRIRVYCVK